MKILDGQINNRMVLKRILVALLAAGMIGIALKFITFQIILNENLARGNILADLFFPYFPNLLDSAYIIVGATILAFLLLKK